MSYSVYNVFSPNSVIESIRDFAGRQEQLEKAATALSMKGASIVIFGYRGVGKSSLAQQVRHIAENDEATISRLPDDLQHNYSFKSFFINAAFGVDDVNGALLGFFGDDQDLRKYLPRQLLKAVDDLQLSGSLKVSPVKNMVEVTAGSNLKHSEETAPIQVDRTIFTAFRSAVLNCSKDIGRELIFFIDEFDKIKHKNGFGDFMKACEMLPVRFCLVGIAQDIPSLLADHESARRLIRDGQIRVPPMSEAEQQEIFTGVHEKLDGAYEFSVDARNFIISCSQGHPYIVHKLGHEALLLAKRRQYKMVTESIARQALKAITKDPSAFDLESQFRQAVKDSSHREYVLKAFSKVDGDEIRTKVVYAKIAEDAEIRRESIPTFVGHLLKEEFGQPLVKVRHGVYRFRDRIFKAYCAARPYDFWIDE
ncbi:MAG: ATP-binding protein [Tabrizicola sp.]